MGRRNELQEIGRYRDARIRGDATRRAHRALDDRARRAVSEYTRLERRPIAHGGSPIWSSLTWLAWLMIAAGVLALAMIVAIVVLAR